MQWRRNPHSTYNPHSAKGQAYLLQRLVHLHHSLLALLHPRVKRSKADDLRAHNAYSTGGFGARNSRPRNGLDIVTAAAALSGHLLQLVFILWIGGLVEQRLLPHMLIAIQRPVVVRGMRVPMLCQGMGSRQV